VLFYCMDLRFYQKILQNYGFFFKKNWDIWNPKFLQNSIVYYFFFIFFSIFGIWFSISPIQTCPIIMEFFVVFYSKGHFTNDFWKILKVLLEKKILICEIFFFQNFAVYYFFFYFFIIFDVLFSIWSICTCKKILEIFRFFYFMDLKFYQKMLENNGVFL